MQFPEVIFGNALGFLFFFLKYVFYTSIPKLYTMKLGFSRANLRS